MSVIRAKSAFRTIQVTSFATFIALMSACGGGGGSTDDALGNGSREANETPIDPPVDTPDTETPALELALGTGEGDSFQQGQLNTALGNNDLAYGGELEVRVNIVDSSDNSLYTDADVQVRFYSDCVEDEKATIESPIITSNGVARSIYTATTCEGNETIWATINGSRAEVSFDVASIETGSLEFVSVESGTIALKGTGSTAIPETTRISFIVKDKEGNPIPGETLTYALSTTAGGLSLSRTSSVTNEEGIASVFLNAGTVQTTVSIIASMEASYGGTLTISSPAISVVGAIPDQDSFSISASLFNPAGADYDGVISNIKISAGDRNNNPAPDSTRISFVTDGGSIVGSCALTNGECTVAWKSQLPHTDSGLVNILARSTGEESFKDDNGNGQFDLGEEIETPVDEAYLDTNNNGSYDFGEFFSDFNGSGDFTRKADSPGMEFYQGASCSEEALAAGHCASLIEVRNSITLCMSTEEARISDNRGGVFDIDTDDTVLVTVSDRNGLTPASGTKIEIDAVDLEIIAGDKVTVPNTCSTQGFTFPIIVKEDGRLGAGKLIITVEQPGGDKQYHEIDVLD